MRLFEITLMALAVVLVSCSSQKSRVERESKVRSRIEAYDSFLDSTGTLQYDLVNGKKGYLMRCASCHGNDGFLIKPKDADNFGGIGQSAIRDPKRFFQIVSFGTPHAEMDGFGDDVGMQDLIDIMGYTMTLTLH